MAKLAIAREVIEVLSITLDLVEAFCRSLDHFQYWLQYWLL